MALQMDFPYRGLTVRAGYVRVVSVVVGKAALTATVTFHVAGDQPSLEAETYTVPHDLKGENALVQAYVGLKALPEFAGAADC